MACCCLPCTMDQPSEIDPWNLLLAPTFSSFQEESRRVLLTDVRRFGVAISSHAPGEIENKVSSLALSRAVAPLSGGKWESERNSTTPSTPKARKRSSLEGKAKTAGGATVTTTVTNARGCCQNWGATAGFRVGLTVCLRLRLRASVLRCSAANRKLITRCGPLTIEIRHPRVPSTVCRSRAGTADGGGEVLLCPGPP